jgi:hypothetical protein
VRVEAENLKQEIAVALSGLDATQMDARPAGRAAAWSIRQIAEHLRLSFDLTAHAFREQLSRDRTTRAVASMRQLIEQFLILRMGRFSSGAKAHPLVEPTRHVDGENGEAMAARIGRSLDSMLELITVGEMKYQDRRAVRHYALGPMTARHWRLFHIQHTRHHIRQIAAIRKQAGV